MGIDHSNPYIHSTTVLCDSDMYTTNPCMCIIHVCCFYVHIIIPSVYTDPEFLYIDPCIVYLLIAYYVHTDGREHFKVVYFVNIYVCNTSYSLLCKR